VKRRKKKAAARSGPIVEEVPVVDSGGGAGPGLAGAKPGEEMKVKWCLSFMLALPYQYSVELHQ